MNEDCGTDRRWRYNVLLARELSKYVSQILSGILSVETAADRFADDVTREFYRNYYDKFVNVRDIGLGQEAISPIENSDRQAFDEIYGINQKDIRKMIFGEEHCNKFADPEIISKNRKSIDTIDLTKEESEQLDQFLSQFKVTEGV